MRRIKILFYWLFKARFNVSLIELIRFLSKPTVQAIGNRYIEKFTEEKDFHIIHFSHINTPLYWPKKFPVEGIYQVSAETFDTDDWHFYQKTHTEITDNEIILDIGTAEGLLPLTVVDRIQKIIMIEPSAHFCQVLEKTFEPFSHKVQILHTAVGKESGEVFLDERSLSSGVSTTGQKISIKTIDELIGENEKITYLKADIEGFEYDMLLGARKTIQRNKPKIAITTYHKSNDYQEIIKLIQSYVPEYKYYVKGVFHEAPKPVMVHFYLSA